MSDLIWVGICGFRVIRNLINGIWYVGRFRYRSVGKLNSQSQSASVTLGLLLASATVGRQTHFGMRSTSVTDSRQTEFDMSVGFGDRWSTNRI